MFAPAHRFASASIRIPRHVETSRTRPCYHWKRMTLSFSFFRLLRIFGLCACLSLQSASSPVAGPGNSEGAEAKPVVHFTDVAQKAGLTAPVIFGGENTKKYIIETTGTGVAIFDYDNRDGSFTDVTAKSGLTHTGWGQGVCVGDYDNDGFEDLYVTYYGKNVLYHNNGNGTFTEVG